MPNPITNKSNFEKCLVDNCCVCMTLRTGTLIIGIVHLVFGVFWLINSAAGHNAGSYTGFVSCALEIVAGILCILGVRKGAAKYLWYAIYLMIIVCIWMIIYAVIGFISLYWSAAIGAIINLLVTIYMISVVRSYAFELEGAVPATNPA